MRVLGSGSVVMVLLWTVACGPPKEPVDTVCSTMLPLDFEGTRLTYEGVVSLQLVVPTIVDFTGSTTYEGQDAWGMRQTVQQLVDGQQIQIVHDRAFDCREDGMWLLGGSVRTSLNEPGDLGTDTYTYASPPLMLPPDPKSGDEWSSEYELLRDSSDGSESEPIVGVHSVAVIAAGSMTIDGEPRKTVTLQLDDTLPGESIFQRYARGIGLVEDEEYTLLGLAR